MHISYPTAQMSLTEPEPQAAAAEPQWISVGEDEPWWQILTC